MAAAKGGAKKPMPFGNASKKQVPPPKKGTGNGGAKGGKK